MAPNAAACFLLAGLSLWLLRESDSRPLTSARKMAAKAPAAMVSLTGLFTLAEHLFRRDFGIDRLLLLRSSWAADCLLSHPDVPNHRRGFLLLGLALQGIDWRTKRRYWPAQFFCLPAFIAPAFALLGLMLGTQLVSPITCALAGGCQRFWRLSAGLLVFPRQAGQWADF